MKSCLYSEFYYSLWEGYGGIAIPSSKRPEWISTHPKRSAKTYGCIGPNACCPLLRVLYIIKSIPHISNSVELTKLSFRLSESHIWAHLFWSEFYIVMFCFVAHQSPIDCFIHSFLVHLFLCSIMMTAWLEFRRIYSKEYLPSIDKKDNEKRDHSF
jgi:hypothetical protein